MGRKNTNEKVEERRQQAYEMLLEGYNESTIAPKLQVDQSTISRDLAVMARRDRKWYHDNQYLKDRLERYYAQTRSRFIHLIELAFNEYRDPDNRNKPGIRLAALRLAETTHNHLAEYIGIPDLQTMSFSDEIEAMRNDFEKLKADVPKQWVRPLAQAEASHK